MDTSRHYSTFHLTRTLMFVGAQENYSQLITPCGLAALRYVDVPLASINIGEAKHRPIRAIRSTARVVVECP